MTNTEGIKSFDIGIIAITFLLVGISLIMIYSTTGVVAEEKFGDAFFYVKRQGLAALLGIVLMALLSRTPLPLLAKWSWICFPISLILLSLTLIPGIRDEAGGAHRWVNLGLLRFQPGELVKLLMVVFLAGYFTRQAHRVNLFTSGIVKPLFFVGVMAGLYLLQPDFGSAAVLTLTVVAIATACGVPLRYIAACGLVVIVLGAIAVLVSPYRMMRVVSFLSPFQDKSGSGYQLIQSLIAIGSGHISGVGLGESQQKLFFLPAAHTDFLFAVIGEELGFVGCFFIILLFLVFLWRGFRIATHVEHHTFAFALAVGLTLLIVIPAMLNMGVVSGVLPTKGLVLPLVGYGGTNLVMSLAAVGLLLSISRLSHKTSQ